MIKNYDVTVRHLEAIQVLAGRLRVVDVFVNNVSCTTRLVRVAQADLPYRAILAKDVVHLVAGDLIRQTPVRETHKEREGREIGIEQSVRVESSSRPEAAGQRGRERLPNV